VFCARSLVFVPVVAAACQPVATPPRNAIAVVLPRSSSDTPASGGPELEIDGTEIRLNGIALEILRSGAPIEGAFESRVSSPLQAELLRLSQTTSPGGPTDDLRGVPLRRLRLIAGAHTRQAALAGVLRTATTAGFHEFELAVTGPDGEHGLPISVPLEWLPPLPEGTKIHRPAAIALELGQSGARGIVDGSPPIGIPPRPGCTDDGDGCVDLDRLSAWAESVRADMPHEVAVTLRAEDAVTIQGLVSAMDALRGHGCRLAGAALRGEAIPETCLLWNVIVDAVPPVVVAPT
jgi:hypothetical protein